MAFLDEEALIERSIINELIAVTPEHWSKIRMVVEFRVEPGGHEGLAHTVLSPQGHRDLIEPSSKTYDLTFKLRELFKKWARGWKRADINAELDDEGAWKYEVQYEYD